LKGIYVDKDPNAAFKLFQKGFDLQLSTSMFNLVWYYKRGIDTNQNHCKAFEMFSIGAE
jgi:TPR repeat protein